MLSARSYAVLLVITFATNGRNTAAATKNGCQAPLIWTQSGYGPESCDSAGSRLDSGHYWPLSGNPEDCHGWVAYDKEGKRHENSSNNIRCSDDGMRMLYTQYPDTIDCKGGKKPDGEEKEFVLNECHQGIPQVLYDIGIDFSCCKNPNSEACQKGTPKAYAGAGNEADIYINGELCSVDEDVEEEKDWAVNASVWSPKKKVQLRRRPVQHNFD